MVDNGSARTAGPRHRSAPRREPARRGRRRRTSSPVRAANLGLELARGSLDRPAHRRCPDGVARTARREPGAPRPSLVARSSPPPPSTSARSRTCEPSEVGYDQSAEDELLDRSGWEEDGYRLFEICTLAGSSSRGIFGHKGESNSLFMPRPLWDELGGLDVRFELPGGGLANHDLYRRALPAPRNRAHRAPRRSHVPPVPRGRGHVATFLVRRDARRLPGDSRRTVPAAHQPGGARGLRAPLRPRPHRAVGAPRHRVGSTEPPLRIGNDGDF